MDSQVLPIIRAGSIRTHSAHGEAPSRNHDRRHLVHHITRPNRKQVDAQAVIRRRAPPTDIDCITRIFTVNVSTDSSPTTHEIHSQARHSVIPGLAVRNNSGDNLEKVIVVVQPELNWASQEGVFREIQILWPNDLLSEELLEWGWNTIESGLFQLSRRKLTGKKMEQRAEK